MIIPDLIIGEPNPKPTVSFRLEKFIDGISVMARHSEDNIEQTLIELRYHPTTGVLQCVTRDIHTPNLAKVCNVELKHGITTRFENRSQL